MNATAILNKILPIVSPNMHKSRLKALSACVLSLAEGSFCSVTNIGRGIRSKAFEKHRIKRWIPQYLTPFITHIRLRLNMTSVTNLNTIFEDDFDNEVLNEERWFPYYLPHWSSLSDAAASYEINNSCLRLFIGDDQPYWCLEYDGKTKVSGIQTGHFSGKLGSRRGQHRFKKNIRVRHELPELRLFLPRYCRLEMKARARLNPWNLAALWLIGFEDNPEHSGEITFFEVFGDKAGEATTQIGCGIKQINDPLLIDEIDEKSVPISVEDWHLYTMDWSTSGIKFYVNDMLIMETSQSPNYQMQLMLNFYEFPHNDSYPIHNDAWFEIDYIKGYQGN